MAVEEIDRLVDLYPQNERLLALIEKEMNDASYRFEYRRLGRLGRSFIDDTAGLQRSRLGDLIDRVEALGEDGGD